MYQDSQDMLESARRYRALLSVRDFACSEVLKISMLKLLMIQLEQLLVSASSLDADLKANYGGNKDAAKAVGQAVAKKAWLPV